MHCPAQGEGVVWSEDGVAVDGELEVSWTELGEEAAGERDEGYVPSSKGGDGRSQKASGSRRQAKGKGKRTRTESEMESEDDDDEEDEDSEAAHSKGTRKSSRTSKSASPVKKAVKGGKRASALILRSPATAGCVANLLVPLPSPSNLDLPTPGPVRGRGQKKARISSDEDDEDDDEGDSDV